MIKLPREIISFFQGQGCVIVSTIDRDGFPHNSCKGIVKINYDGSVYLLDLYRRKTYGNLKANPHMSITAVDEHKFKGYCLKGKAEIMATGKIGKDLLEAWEERVTGRITRRLLKNIREEKGHSRHPEVLLPKPEYMIAVAVEEIIDFTPQHLK